MSNHFHLIVKIERDQALGWSLDEVIERWTQLYSTPDLIQRYQNDEWLDDSEQEALSDLVESWRERLYSLSWFMRALNEAIARQANQEDNCTGRFWSGRFTSQALLDEAALLTAMAYVDLNPVRAGIAETPEQSDFTSIQQRIQECANQSTQKNEAEMSPAAGLPSLMCLKSDAHNRDIETDCIPIGFEDYLELVDWSGRAIRHDKRGSIASDCPPILIRLGIDKSHFLRHIKRQGNGFHSMIGRLQSLRNAAHQLGVRFFKGQSYAKLLFT
ncbi:MAG: transposase [Wenzhouxiangellaceae bacterium]